MIKALLLDLDCTLLDEDNATAVANKAFYEAHRERLVQESLEDFRQRWREIMSKHWPRYEAGELNFVEQQRERAREALGLKLSGAEADEAFAHHLRAYENGWCCYDDVTEFMQRTKGLLKIAVTNAHRNQQRLKMERTGLLAYIPDLVTPEDAGAWKPDARIFNHALLALGVKAEEAMMIGDDYERDIVPAEKLGMQTFWVRRPEKGLADVEL